MNVRDGKPGEQAQRGDRRATRGAREIQNVQHWSFGARIAVRAGATGGGPFQETVKSSRRMTG
jgi:hypothetical protein